jgi:hypothetical protein
MLAAVLGPFHRPLKPQGGLGHHRILGIEDRLWAKAAADIGCDHADRFRVALQHLGKRALGEMRRLRR